MERKTLSSGKSDLLRLVVAQHVEVIEGAARHRAGRLGHGIGFPASAPIYTQLRRPVNKFRYQHGRIVPSWHARARPAVGRPGSAPENRDLHACAAADRPGARGQMAT